MHTLALTGIGSLVTNDPAWARGPLGLLSDAAVVVAEGLVTWVGASAEVPDGVDEVVDLGGAAVIPGFVDSHAHPVFAGDRWQEFAARMTGEPYSAGGIRTTVAAPRGASDDDLRSNAAGLVAELLASGVTTFEAKSGYGLTTSDELRSLMIARELTPETEMTQGHGFAITGRLRKLGAQPSLGVDLESGISGDMFSVARMALATQRAMDNDESRREAGKLPDTSSITCREALGWITIEGAKMLKMEDRIGSLSPGKQADVVIVRADALNMWPVHDPVLSLITQASVANIETVLVAGEYRKKNNKLRYRDLDAKKQQLLASGHRILSELGLAPAA